MTKLNRNNGKSRILKTLAGIAAAGIFAAFLYPAPPADASGIEWEYRCQVHSEGQTFVLSARPVRDGSPVWHRNADEHPDGYRMLANDNFPEGSDTYHRYGYKIVKNDDNENCRATTYGGRELTGG